MTVKIYEEFSAIPAWFGYNFQGQVALGMALEKMYNKLKSRTGLDINSVSSFLHVRKLILELEYIEDFAIKEGDSYLSIHQVKSGSIDLISDVDKFHFFLAYKEKKPAEACFHFFRDIPTAEDNYLSKVKELAEKYVKLLNIIIANKDLDIINQGIKDNNLQAILGREKEIEKITNLFNGNTKKATVSRILYINMKYIKDSEKNIEKAQEIAKELLLIVQSIIKEIEINEEDWEIDNYQGINGDCDLIKVTNEYIYKILNLVGLGQRVHNNIEYQNCIRLKLYNLIADRIKETNDNDCICQITFAEIFQIIIKDCSAILDNPETLFLFFKECFFRCWTEFPYYQDEDGNYCCENVDSCEYCETISECKINSIMASLLSEKELHKFFSNLCLQIPSAAEDLINFPNGEQIKKMFFKFLKDVKCFNIYEFNKNIIVALKDNKKYRLSLIGHANINDKGLNETLQNKNEFIEFFYETDFLITERITGKILRFNKDNILVSNNEVNNSLSALSIKVQQDDGTDNILNVNEVEVIDEKEARYRFLNRR